MTWLDPGWLLGHFGQEFVWISLVIVFIECGLLFPVLPGDTLLFAIGLFASTDRIRVLGAGGHRGLVLAIVLLAATAFLGNVSGYEIGRLLGPPIAERDGRVLKRRYFALAREFFDRHGGAAVVLGRFVPVVRTFVTVIAGASMMPRRRYLWFSLLGAAGWTALVSCSGFFLGAAFPALGENVDAAVLLLVAVSLVPVGIEWLRRRRTSTRHQ